MDPCEEARTLISLPLGEIRVAVDKLHGDEYRLQELEVQLVRTIQCELTPRGLYALSRVYYLLRKSALVESVRETLHVRFPETVEYYLCQGEVSERQKEFVAAHAAYTEAARLQPDEFMRGVVKRFFDRWGGNLSGRKGPAQRREQPAWVYSLREDPTPTTTPVPIPRTP